MKLWKRIPLVAMDRLAGSVEKDAAPSKRKRRWWNDLDREILQEWGEFTENQRGQVGQVAQI